MHTDTQRVEMMHNVLNECMIIQCVRRKNFKFLKKEWKKKRILHQDDKMDDETSMNIM